MSHHRLLFLIVIILIPLLVSGCASPPDTASVSRVIDGDTIVIGSGQRVRYIGIDTPEVHPGIEKYGLEALQANREMVEGKRVRLERDVSDTDKYGRLLRYVFVDELFVNAELVRLGLAEAVAYPPDTRYQDYLEEMETEARETGRGMWAK